MEGKVDLGEFYRQKGQQHGEGPLTSGHPTEGIAGSAAAGCPMESASKEHGCCHSIHGNR